MRSTKALAGILVAVTILAGGCVDSGSTTTPTAPIAPLADGSLAITVSTSGDDPDIDGYQVSIYRQGETPKSSFSIEPNASKTVPGLRVGNYTVALSGLASNCDVLSSNTVGVSSGTESRITLRVRCRASVELTFAMGDGWDFDATPREFWTVSSNGGPAVQLTNDRSWHETPSWSPDGKRMVYSTDRGGRYNISLWDGSGKVVSLGHDFGEDFSPRLSKDGSRIAFTRPTTGRMELYTMRADGSNPIRVIASGEGDYHPDWSPDGLTLVFASKRGGVGGIWLVRTDGSGLTRLTSNPFPTGGDYNPVWSPDGSTIVFHRTSGAGAEFYQMKPDGSGLARFAAEFDVYGSPAWSPDGKQIAFTGKLCEQGKCQEGIHVIGIDGTHYSPAFVGDVVGAVAWRPKP